MRNLYSFVWWLILPFALFRLWLRGRKEPGYRQHISERLGSFPPSAIKKNCIWVHAVSVGETRAAEPLVHALLLAYPEKDILLTCMTPTGRATGFELFGDNPRIMQAYLPYDLPHMMRRLITHFHPVLCILMETEIWPNLIAQCKKNHVTVALVNARLSERSLRKGQRLPSLIKEAADGISYVAAQTRTDAKRLKQFGSQHVEVVGSVKFDVQAPSELIKKGQHLRELIGQRPVFICASTRDGEEARILDVLSEISPPNTLVIIVPRHPQRFDEVAKMIASRKLPMIRRSDLATDFGQANSISPDTRILLGDSMGEMFMYYTASDLAFIGGSLEPLGGQNLIEPCSIGIPVIVGPHTFNFEAITEDAISEGAVIRIHSADELMQKTSMLLDSPEKRHMMGERARAFALQQRGATERTLAILKPVLTGKNS